MKSRGHASHAPGFSSQHTWRELFVVFSLALRRPGYFRQSEGAGGTKLLGAPQRACADSVQQFGLRGFQGDQSAEHMQQVDQIVRVFGKPMVRLDRVKRRRRATVANDRSRAVAAAIRRRGRQAQLKMRWPSCTHRPNTSIRRIQSNIEVKSLTHNCSTANRHCLIPFECSSSKKASAFAASSGPPDLITACRWTSICLTSSRASHNAIRASLTDVFEASRSDRTNHAAAFDPYFVFSATARQSLAYMQRAVSE